MPILTTDQYISRRERFGYTAPKTSATILGTQGVAAQDFTGIYSENPPAGAISIRKFEQLMQSVFLDCAGLPVNALTQNQINNLQNISLALVHWKMASQGGRADRARNNVLAKWGPQTIIHLMNAYNVHADNPIEPNVRLFQIEGVRTATASAFLRFLFPDRFGVVDSRVVGLVTNPGGYTNFSIRQKDNYINDTERNRAEYNTVYIQLLNAEADWLNNAGVTFNDPDPNAAGPQMWRPCDVEMALW